MYLKGLYAFERGSETSITITGFDNWLSSKSCNIENELIKRWIQLSRL